MRQRYSVRSGASAMLEVGQRVRVHCVGTLENGLHFCDSRRSGAAVEFALGSATFLPALESIIRGMELGEKREVVIPAAEAYGDYDESLIEAIPADDIPRAYELPVGDYIEMQTSMGILRMRVMKVENGMVYLDHNHELAGEDLRFEVELVEIVKEDAIEHEKHPAGCACGCDKLKESLES